MYFHGGGFVIGDLYTQDVLCHELAIILQLLIYPATDQRCSAPSHQTNGQGYLLTKDTIDYFMGHYITDPSHNLDPRASPLLQANLSRLPHALVLTAGYDPLRGEGLMYSQRLSEAGNRATHSCVAVRQRIATRESRVFTLIDG